MNMFTGKTTSELEAELRNLSATITIERNKVTDDQSRFQSITAELKRRNETGENGEVVPEPVEQLTELQLANKKLEDADRVIRTLSLKITEMEAEQARLVVEKVQAQFEKKEAEEQLALVRKYYKPADNA